MKSKIQSSIITSAVIAFSIATNLLAQNTGDEMKVNMQIDFVSWGEDISGLEIRDGEIVIPVKALAFRYSESLEYSGSQILALGFGHKDGTAKKENMEAPDRWRGASKESETVVSEATSGSKKDHQVLSSEIPSHLAKARETDPSLAALIMLPTNSRRVTILLAPGPDRTLVPHVLDDDPSRQPLGMVRVHNFSPHPISLNTSDGKSKGLDPGKNFISPAPGSTFAYELAYQINGVSKIQENNLVSVSSDELIHMVVLRNNSSFFSSSDGSRGGFMQVALLRRNLR